MGYLSFQIIFFLLLAALLGFIIGWLLRGSRFQTELQDLDARWRTKLGEVEGERDRFVAELTQANDAKSRLEAELKRLSETHEGSLDKLKRDHETKIAAFADTEKTMVALRSDLAAKSDEVGRVQADLAKAQQSGGDSARLGNELAAASERVAKLEGSLKDSQSAHANCRSEVERLKAEIAELKRGGGAAAGTASSGGALGLMGGSGVSSSTSPSGTGSAGTGGGAGGSAGGAGGAATGGSAGIGGGGAGGTGSPGSTGGAGAGGSGSAGSAGLSGVSSGTGSSDPGYSQRAASPSYLADSSGGNFSGSTGQTSDSGSARDSAEAQDEEEGVQPAALAAARDGRADDLKLISGVGPKLEKTLNGLGIFHFWQIAEFTPDNVAWVDRHLRFKGRIERENWIEQAKVLATGGETEFSKRQ